MPISTALLERIEKNPNGVLDALDKALASKRLIDFTEYMWPILEPGKDFVRSWAIEALCEHLEAVSRGEIQHLLANVPPGFMKSMSTNVFWPAWEWGPLNRPDLRINSFSYSHDLTIRDNRRTRILIESDRYQAIWGDRFRLSADQNNKIRYDNNHRGFRFASTVQGTATGERGDRNIVDDPHNVKTAESDTVREGAIQFFTEVLPTRTTDIKTTAVIVIMQRVHEGDVSGHILKNDLGYDHLCIPMEYEAEDAKSATSIGWTDPRKVEGELADPERFPRDEVEKLKKVLSSWGGSYAVAGQLQQRPVPRGGGMFKRHWFTVVPRTDVPPGGFVARGWDLAGSTLKTSPWTASVRVRWVNNTLYIEHVFRDRLTAAGVEGKITSLSKSDDELGPTVQDLPQDPGQAGKAQKRTIAGLLAGHQFFVTPESGAKEDRAVPVAAQAEAGNVVLVAGGWNDAFLDEVASFPKGSFKDQVDALSRAYARILAMKAGGPTVFGQAVAHANN